MRIKGYELQEELGRGDTAVVYRAMDEKGQDFALKISLDGEAFRIGQMKQEAEVLSWLKDEAVPRCYESFDYEDKACVVMDYIRGQAFDSLLQSRKEVFTETEVIQWGLILCDVLNKIHRHDVPHIYAFLAPSHVILSDSGKLYLLDYGKVLSYEPNKQYPALGLAGYSPPEQYVGKQEPRSDVFSLGVFLYELTTRRDPRISHAAFLFHVLPPRSLNPALSADFEALVLKAVEHKAQDRFSSIAEMRDALLAVKANP
jgi:serine/threonine protein kinase